MRPVSARLVLAAVLLVVPPTLAAQTVDEIVAKHEAALGGRQALAAVRTLRMTGVATAGPGRQAIVRREIARPGRIRTEFVFQGTTGVYAWDGREGWRVSPLDGGLEPEPLPAEEAALAAEQADFEGPLVGWKARGHRVELVGTETLAGGPAHRLKVTTPSGVVRDVWVDAATGHLVRRVSTGTFRGRTVAFETLFGDYRDTGGVRFPRAIEAGVPGRPRRLRIVVETVEVNPALDETRFEMPR
jgi:hypothetical protein